MNAHVEFHKAAREAVRRHVRQAMFESILSSDRVSDELERVENAVMDALECKDIQWALAYLAGVQMAPRLLHEMAQSPPAQPQQSGGG